MESPLHGPEEADRLDASARSDDARIKHLERVPLFSGLSDDQLGRVAGISKIVEARAETVLTRMGEPGDSFFVLIDGRASVQTQVGVGDPLKPGDFFGEMSLLDGGPRSATVVTETAARLLVITRRDFAHLLAEAPELNRAVLAVLCRRVRQAEQALNA
ncbi:MAG TPA: cyclic nucleotide-binding domain-containing protein [Methylomirabilota bacterium]